MEELYLTIAVSVAMLRSLRKVKDVLDCAEESRKLWARKGIPEDTVVVKRSRSEETEVAKACVDLDVSEVAGRMINPKCEAMFIMEVRDF